MRARHPILKVLFEQGRSTAWLARQTGFNRVYLCRVFNQHMPATATIRERCSSVLGLPDSALFHPDSRDATEAPAA